MSKNKFIAHGNVFDESTLRGIFTLSGQGYFEEIEGPISTGKESNVFSVKHGKGKRVVKIYRTSANFKKMYDYMKSDPEEFKKKAEEIGIEVRPLIPGEETTI